MTTVSFNSAAFMSTDAIIALNRLLPAMEWLGEVVILCEWGKEFPLIETGANVLPYDETLLERVTEWVANGCTEWIHHDDRVIETSNGSPIWCSYMYPMKGFEEAPNLLVLIKNYKPKEHELKWAGY
jgi:hypothetical protein